MSISTEAMVKELECALGDKKIGERAELMRRITDLFIVTSGSLSNEHTAVFDQVMKRLLEEIDTSARARFSQLLAPITNAPPETVRALALDDAINVAGPMLSQSEVIDNETLIEGAEAKSQAHLLAISHRKNLEALVTDVLVDRGDERVALSVASNRGAKFSELGYSRLVQRSTNSDELATCIWARPEIPRAHLVRLFADASESLKTKLKHQNPGNSSSILEIVASASRRIQEKARASSLDYAIARSNVESLEAKGCLGESGLAEYATAGKFDETAILLSHICDLPLTLIERALVDDRFEHIIVMARGSGLLWDTVKAILLLKTQARSGEPLNLDLAFETYARLDPVTAKKAIQFYRLRARAVNSVSH